MNKPLKQKNLVTLLSLLGIIVLLFFVTIVKITTQQP
jgi:hypothetical protein